MSSSRALCCLPSVKKQKHFFVNCKTIIRFGFCDIQNNQGRGKGYQPKPKAEADNPYLANEARSAEVAIIISYPTSASGIIVLLKTPPKNKELDYNENKKGPKNHAYARHFCRSWYNGSYTMMAKPMKSLELHYPMIQFLIIVDTRHTGYSHMY